MLRKLISLVKTRLYLKIIDCLCFLFQTARPVFLSYESMSGILNEFRCLDLKKILTELLFLTEQETVELPVLLICMYGSLSTRTLPYFFASCVL